MGWIEWWNWIIALVGPEWLPFQHICKGLGANVTALEYFLTPAMVPRGSGAEHGSWEAWERWAGARPLASVVFVSARVRLLLGSFLTMDYPGLSLHRDILILLSLPRLISPSEDRPFSWRILVPHLHPVSGWYDFESYNPFMIFFFEFKYGLRSIKVN